MAFEKKLDDIKNKKPTNTKDNEKNRRLVYDNLDNNFRPLFEIVTAKLKQDGYSVSGDDIGFYFVFEKKRSKITLHGAYTGDMDFKFQYYPSEYMHLAITKNFHLYTANTAEFEKFLLDFYEYVYSNN